MFRLKLVPADTSIPFIAWRKVAIACSLLVMLASVVVAIAPGLNFGIDFKGGTLMEVRTPQATDLGQMRTVLNGLGLGDVALQTFGAEDDVLLRVQQQPGGAPAQQAAVVKVQQALNNSFGKVDYRRVEFVGPKVSGELIEAGVLAVGLAVVLMLIYIWFRFEWHFGVAAVLALVHDVTISVGFLALTHLEFNLSTIAALLTIVGYSINDTVVVFDRVRENLRRYKSLALPQLLDTSINETLSRTTMTSFTTLLALIALALFGGEVIRGFVLVMIWGIVIGTYSSIFVASPLLIWLGLEKKRGSLERAEAGAT